MAKGGYRGGMPMGGMNQMQMMKQAQKMQQDLLKMQQEMEEKQYEATAGGGVITAVVSGKREKERIALTFARSDFALVTAIHYAGVVNACRLEGIPQIPGMSRHGCCRANGRAEPRNDEVLEFGHHALRPTQRRIRKKAAKPMIAAEMSAKKTSQPGCCESRIQI